MPPVGVVGQVIETIGNICINEGLLRIAQIFYKDRYMAWPMCSALIPNGPYEACEPLAYLCPLQIRKMARSLAAQRVQRAGHGAGQ